MPVQPPVVMVGQTLGTAMPPPGGTPAVERRAAAVPERAAVEGAAGRRAGRGRAVGWGAGVREARAAAGRARRTVPAVQRPAAAVADGAAVATGGGRAGERHAAR